MWIDLQDFSSPLEHGGGTDQGTGPPQDSKTSQPYLQSLISHQPEEERRVKINPIGCGKDVNSSEEKGILDGRHLGIPTDLRNRPLCLLASLDHTPPLRMIFIFSCKLKVLPVSSRLEASHTLSSFHYPSLLHLLLRVSDGYKYTRILSSPLNSRRRPGRLRSRERGARP